MLRLLLLLSFVVFVACGSPDTCNAGNCPGCCLAGVCSAGTTVTECGARGNLCVACPAGQACVSGACALRVGGGTGGGTGGGSGGGTGGGAGGCTADSCATPTDICLNNACSSGLGRGYRVTFVSATAPSTDNGAAWDALGGAPDLKACLTVDTGTPVCTSEVSDVFTASWNESTQVTVVASTQVRIDFYDVDVSSDDSIDAFTISSASFIGLVRRGGLMGRPYTNAPSTWNIRIEPL